MWRQWWIIQQFIQLQQLKFFQLFFEQLFQQHLIQQLFIEFFQFELIGGQRLQCWTGYLRRF